MRTRIRLAAQLIRSCNGHGAGAGAGVAIVMCGGGASHGPPWQLVCVAGLASPGPLTGDAAGVGEPAFDEGAAVGCVAVAGLLACAIAVAGANAKGSSATASARSF